MSLEQNFNTTPAPFHGFVTGRNKQIHVKEESIQRALKIMQEEGCPDFGASSPTPPPPPSTPSPSTPSPTPSFHGFVTASNKQIDVADESLQKAKKIMDGYFNLTPSEF
eukprot:TRINITY_DN1164_c0_g1_i1.p2 TRINITY_DN1164_c0_g1~~TRINITY_DN1164_c0_g1_i1.p2  ORF type:complete len:109 (+),score=25.99 TRINITY_DN1164_c0_g1_i1:218-544(+)